MSMKIKENPDGTKELEGTPEELAEFERRRRGEVKEDKKDKKKLLLEEAEVVSEYIRKILIEELDKRPLTTITFPSTPAAPPHPFIGAPRISPFIGDEPPWDPYKITWGLPRNFSDCGSGGLIQ